MVEVLILIAGAFALAFVVFYLAFEKVAPAPGDDDPADRDDPPPESPCGP